MEAHEADDHGIAIAIAHRTQYPRRRMRGTQVESNNRKEVEGMGEGEAGGEEVIVQYHHKSCKPCLAKLQVQRLHQQEEGTEAEAAQDEVGHRGSFSVRLQVVASLEGS